MKAAAIIEKLVGPTAEVVDRIVYAIIHSETVDQANAKLSPFNIQFEDHEAFRSTGAHGGCIGTRVLLNPRFFHVGDVSDWRTVVAHELTHMDQLGRASASGADGQDIAARKMKQLTRKDGHIDMDKYLRDPLEMQAFARNAIDSAKASGKSIKPLLRSGKLSAFAPQRPRDAKRFGKYAYQMYSNGQH